MSRCVRRGRCARGRRTRRTCSRCGMCGDQARSAVATPTATAGHSDWSAWNDWSTWNYGCMPWVAALQVPVPKSPRHRPRLGARGHIRAVPCSVTFAGETLTCLQPVGNDDIRSSSAVGASAAAEAPVAEP
eukprot:5074227-Prymnesium_polylepis.1